MENSRKSVAHRVCVTILRPLASMLLRCGMTWKEFSDLSKAQFVKAATEEFGIRGRPTNISRVSILTGISRKEVKRQRDLLAQELTPVKSKTTDATRVLSAWYQDPDYLDENAMPLLLPESGSAPSFESLCRTYGGDIAMPTMLKELLNTETIARADDGLLEVKRRYYQPAVLDNESLIWAADAIRDLAETTNRNVFRDGKSEPPIVGKAENIAIPTESVAKFRDYLDVHGQAFLELIDDWLTEHEAKNESKDTNTVRLGVGLFTIHSDEK